MKKFISGIIVGVLLFAGTTTFADSIGLVGKKVTGIYTIEKDGRTIAEAAIINGSAYAPVRAVAEATGADLKVEGKKIVLNTDTAQVVESEQGKIDDLNVRIAAIKIKIESAQSGVKMYETTYIPNAQRNYDGAYDEISKTTALQALDARKAEYEQRKTELAELEAQLAELNAQLIDLEK
ncbi:hypothetical protein D3C74_270040 [compost metagenome]